MPAARGGETRDLRFRKGDEGDLVCGVVAVAHGNLLESFVFRAWGLGFGVWGSGFGVQGSGLKVEDVGIKDLGLRVWGSGLRV